MSTPRKRILACLLLALMAGTVAFSAKDRPYRIAGAQRNPDKEWVPVEVMEQANRGVACQIRYLAPEARVSAMQSAVPSSMEIFPGRAVEKNATPGYIVPGLSKSIEGQKS